MFCNRMNIKKSQRSHLLHFSALCDIFRKKKSEVFQKQMFCSQLGKSGFRFFSSMKGTLWVSRNCFLSFSKIRPGHVLKTLRFLSLRYSADFRRSRLVGLVLAMFLKSQSYEFAFRLHFPPETITPKGPFSKIEIFRKVSIFRKQPVRSRKNLYLTPKSM